MVSEKLQMVIDRWESGVLSDPHLGLRTKRVAAMLARYFRARGMVVTVSQAVLASETGLLNPELGLRALRRYGWLVSSQAGPMEFRLHPIFSASAAAARARLRPPAAKACEAGSAPPIRFPDLAATRTPGRNRTHQRASYLPRVCPGAFSGQIGGRKIELSALFYWWAVTGSNCRQPVCKTDALPLS
jgi:hypothetical protein